MATNTPVQTRGTKRPRRRQSAERAESQFEQKIIGIRRVARVVAGGRRFSFSASVVLGDKNGSVGVGVGKATNTSVAITKAAREARKSMIKVPRTESFSIPHEVAAKYCSARVLVKPTRGVSLIAGGAVRSVLELAGVHGATAKIVSRSKNQLNNARAAVKALASIRT